MAQDELWDMTLREGQALLRAVASLTRRSMGVSDFSAATRAVPGIMGIPWEEKTMDVRALDASELSSLLDLYQHLHAADDPLPGAQAVAAVWQELMGSPWHKVFGAYAGGKLVSSCTLTVIPNLTRRCRPYGVIENVVTNAAYRRQGLAKAVLDEALGFAWGGNCYKVMLMTGRKDEATFRFYESAGFDRHGKQAFIARPPASGGPG
ncbi:GNAT family N-acetyltransferase [Achromobacter anxifer]